MKKFLSIALTALLVAAMAVPTFAGYEAHADAESGNIKFDVQKANVAWNPDGVMSEGEYYTVAIQDSWLSAAVANDDEMADAFAMNPTFAMSWDENYIYTYSQYNVKEFNSAYEGNEGSMWQGAAIQMNLADADCTDGDRLEYGISMDSSSKAQISTIWNDYLGTYSEVPTSDYKVFVDGTTMTYEVRTPISAFSANANAKLGDTYGYCIVWAAGYVEGEHLHLQLASGCTGDPGKQAANFAKINLVAAPEIAVEEEAPAAEEAPTETTTAAQTSDATAAFAVLGVVALGAAAIVAKKVRG